MATNIVDDIFSKEVQKTISDVCDSQKPDLITNHRRSDYLNDYLKTFGFKEVGCGTNRIVFRHRDIEDKVFKIALDSRGILDNQMEEKLYEGLSDIVPTFYDTNGLILIAERIYPLEHSSEYYEYADEIQDVIDSISSRYILNDIGPKSFLNWGRDINGRMLILDYAYLTPIENCKQLICRKCDSNLKYNNDLTMIKCTNKKCKAVYSIADITGSHVDPLVELGFMDDTLNDEFKAKEKMIKGDDDVLEKMGFE